MAAAGAAPPRAVGGRGPRRGELWRSYKPAAGGEGGGGQPRSVPSPAARERMRGWR